MSFRERARREDGIALVIALMAMSLLLALGLALTMTTMTEARIAGHYQREMEVFYAADAAVERAGHELLATPDWDGVLQGTLRSSFTDGVPGSRLLPDGTPFDLSEATNLVRCNKRMCSTADLTASTSERPWGANNPVWQPYAYGRLDNLLPGREIDSPAYVIVWVADDPSENDGDPFRDGAPPVGCDSDDDPSCIDRNAGRGRIALLARALGSDGSQRTIEVTLGRSRGVEEEGEHGTPRTHLVSWREGE